MVRDVLSSKPCVSLQRFCLAAIYSKLVGSATMAGETSPVDRWQGGARQKIGNNILKAREVKHLHIKLKNELPGGIVDVAVTRDRAVCNGLWSVESQSYNG